MRRQPKLDREERRENALRPSRYLGYNWDDLGVYFIERGAFRIAEMQLRRAVWLNPFEPEFKIHLAGCLFRLEQYAEAREWIIQAIKATPQREDVKNLLRLIESRVAGIHETSDPAALSKGDNCASDGEK